jgi:hypothetical protein
MASLWFIVAVFFFLAALDECEEKRELRAEVEKLKARCHCAVCGSDKVIAREDCAACLHHPVTVIVDAGGFSGVVSR